MIENIKKHEIVYVILENINNNGQNCSINYFKNYVFQSSPFEKN